MALDIRGARGGTDLSSQPVEAPKPAGPLYAWWRGDHVHRLTPPPGFAVRVAENPSLLAELASLSEEEVRDRIRTGNRPYLATVWEEPVGYGWSASGPAHIGGLDLSFHVPEGERYLWDFVTLPEWRGRGIYPLLLQAILREESATATRFWIGHEQENAASGRGIVKAGFRKVVELLILPGRRLALAPTDSPDRAKAGAVLLGLPVLDGILPGR